MELSKQVSLADRKSIDDDDTEEEDILETSAEKIEIQSEVKINEEGLTYVPPKKNFDQNEEELVEVNLEERVITSIVQLYDLFINEDNMIISFHSDVAPAFDLNCDRILKLINIQCSYHKNELSEEGMELEILKLYKTKPFFNFQVKMDTKYFDSTPKKGLCWLLSEYQAYNRGLQKPISAVETWKDYGQHNDIEKILREATDLMQLQQQNDYTEASRIDEKKCVENMHVKFLNAMSDNKKKKEIIKTGDYFDDGDTQWGSSMGFGSFYFSGKGRLEDAPLANYFISNRSISTSGCRTIYCQKNYARLCQIFPYSKEYCQIMQMANFKCFSLNDLAKAFSHNNSILYDNQHFFPFDWPYPKQKGKATIDSKIQALQETWMNRSKDMVKNTLELLKDQNLEPLLGQRNTIYDILYKQFNNCFNANSS
jgi:hypothetical protein